MNLEQLEGEIEHLPGNEATEERRGRERESGGGGENCKIGIILELFLLNSVRDQ